MPSIVHRIRVGGSAVAAVAALSLAGCGGGTVTKSTAQPAPAQTSETASQPAATSAAPETSSAAPATTSAPAADTTSSAPATNDGGSAGGSAQGGDSADELAAKQAFVDFLHAAAKRDYEKACSYFMMPGTDHAPTGSLLKACARELEKAPGSKDITEENASIIQVNTLKAEQDADGDYVISFAGDKYPYKIRKGGDGRMLIVLEP